MYAHNHATGDRSAASRPRSIPILMTGPGLTYRDIVELVILRDQVAASRAHRYDCAGSRVRDDRPVRDQAD